MSRTRRRKRSVTKTRRRRRRRERAQVLASNVLPEDVLQQIFYRLPLKSISRFKLTCKYWNSLLSDPQFLHAYKTHGLVGNDQLIFTRLSSCPRKVDIYTVEYNDLTNHEIEAVSMVALQNYPHQFISISGYMPDFLGSYHGLVAALCGWNKDKCILWNPLTQKYKSVSAEDYYLAYINDSVNLSGLCYDVSSDMYMAVIATKYQSPETLPFGFGYEGILFETSTTMTHFINFKTCTWKRLPKTALEHRIFNGGIGKVVCGVPHWVVKFYDQFENEWLQEEILYFDCDNEDFRQMDIPHDDEKRILGLGALNGETQLAVVFQDLTLLNLEVWVMKEYGKEESWTNLYVIPGLNVQESVNSVNLLGLLATGELLMDVNYKELWVYDSEKGCFRQIQLQFKRQNFTIIANESSLVFPTEESY